MTFSCTGNQQGSDFRIYATNGWLKDCGGGPASTRSILVKIDQTDGTPLLATFIRAQLSNGNANSWVPQALGFDSSGNPIVHGSSYYSPLNADRTLMVCSGSSPFTHHIKFNPGLSSALLSCSTCNQSSTAIGCRPPIDFVTSTNPTTSSTTSTQATIGSTTTGAGTSTKATTIGSTTTGAGTATTTSTQLSNAPAVQGALVLVTCFWLGFLF